MAELIDKNKLMKDIVKRFGCRPHIEVGNKCEYVHTILDEQPTTTEAEIRAKVIDEFAEKLKQEYESGIGIPQKEIDFANVVIDRVAEKLKENKE